MKETIEEKIDELLTRGVEHIYPSRDKLKSALAYALDLRE